VQGWVFLKQRHVGTYAEVDCVALEDACRSEGKTEHLLPAELEVVLHVVQGEQVLLMFGLVLNFCANN